MPAAGNSSARDAEADPTSFGLASASGRAPSPCPTRLGRHDPGLLRHRSLPAAASPALELSSVWEAVRRLRCVPQVLRTHGASVRGKRAPILVLRSLLPSYGAAARRSLRD